MAATCTLSPLRPCPCPAQTRSVQGTTAHGRCRESASGGSTREHGRTGFVFKMGQKSINRRSFPKQKTKLKRGSLTDTWTWTKTKKVNLNLLHAAFLALASNTKQAPKSTNARTTHARTHAQVTHRSQVYLTFRFLQQRRSTTASSSGEEDATNDERRTTNDERRTTNDERRTTTLLLNVVMPLFD